MKNGLPPVRSWIRSARPSSEGSPPARSASSSLVESGPSGISAIRRYTGESAHSASYSGRKLTTARVAVPSTAPTISARNASLPSSIQCRSSITLTTTSVRPGTR